MHTERTDHELRRLAERAAREDDRGRSESLETLSPKDVGHIIHELRVHQIELEMQNDELRRAQTQLDAARARYFDLYDLAPVGYLSVRRDGSIAEANLTVAKLLGITRDAIARQPFSQFVLPADQDTYSRHIKALLDTQQPQTCDLRFTRRGQAPLWARLQSTVACEPDDVTLCRIVVTDISARKLAEQGRLELQGQLHQAQRMEAMGTLAGGVAHDFNNILGGVLGGLSLLEIQLGKPAEAYQGLFRDMEDLVGRGATLAKQLLGLSHTGKHDVQPLNVAAVIEATIGLFGPAHRAVMFEQGFSHDLHRVLMDHTQLEQVLLNLFFNASHAMSNCGTIRVRCENSESTLAQTKPHLAGGGDFVKLTITDSGVGMDEATMARIFAPFFTTKPAGQGSGLGLASVYGIVKNHGGSIEVKSNPGKGTTFTLFLPATTRPAKTPPTAIAPVTHRGQGTILIVDDEPTILSVYAALLTAMGYEVLAANGGHAAVELVREHVGKVSLIILDLTMPGMSGSETYDAIRQLDPHVKVLLASGFAVEGEAQELLTRGCNGFIQKPFSRAALVDKIESLH